MKGGFAENGSHDSIATGEQRQYCKKGVFINIPVGLIPNPFQGFMPFRMYFSTQL